MTTYVRYNQPQRVRLWSVRYLSFADGGGGCARDVVPIMAKDVDHMLSILWKAHHEWLTEELPGIERLSEKARGVTLRRQLDITELCDGIWAKKDFVSDAVVTPFG